MSLTLTPPRHGGDLVAWQQQVDDAAQSWLDLSSACNREPWPIPKIDSDLWMELPDQSLLMTQANDYFGVKPMAIGSGSQQIIEALPLLLKTAEVTENQIVMVPKVGYQEHAFAWQKWGYEVCFYDNLDDLLSQAWNVVVVINPNNPTGRSYDRAGLQAVHAKAQAQSGYLVIDEAFVDAQPELSFLSTLDEEDKSLFILRSVGKFFGLAGARVGFVFCAQAWQAILRNLLGPWPVATPSLHIVGKALADQEWQQRALQSLQQRQRTFAETLIPKFNTIFDSQEYALTPLFATWQLESHEYAQQVFEWLHQVGVHVRLGDGWIRVALPAMNEIRPLDKALIGLLKGAGGRDLA
ncbi:aminotransferase class I/II-fold pyridoxal phosphate-dependent enzyme [Marinomonas sp.]